MIGRDDNYRRPRVGYRSMTGRRPIFPGVARHASIATAAGARADAPALMSVPGSA